MEPNLLSYQMALTLIPGVGDVNGKRLVAYCGGAEAVFHESRTALLKIPGIGQNTVNSIVSQQVFHLVEKEILFIEKNEVEPLFFTDKNYPQRLLNCEDGPMLLYYKGTTNLNASRMIAFVGTRKATDYGRERCEEIISDLKVKDVVVVSGLAYGIDSCAHRKSVECGIDTIGVMGHGLDRIYPFQHQKLAMSMLENGGLLTEFPSGTNPDRENFPKRNRIVAGMCDAVIVIESGIKGGAMITATLANSYNRDAFAVPGRTNDEYSKGCNMLIKSNRAALAESAKDISYIMGWDDRKPNVKSQTSLFLELTGEEKKLLTLLNSKTAVGMDQLIAKSAMTPSKVASTLLNLEFEGLVKSLPGKLYKIIA
jgi:DNA processing protein